MNEIEQAHKILQDIILNGQITLRGASMSLAELSRVVKAEQLLFNVAQTATLAAAESKEPVKK